MAKLTEKRLSEATDILERHRRILYQHGCLDAGTLERDLRQLWGVGYQGIKPIMIDLFKKHPRYKYMAAYYMQHSNCPGPVSEFMPTLAALYHLPMFSVEEREESAKSFWTRFGSEDAKTLRRQIDEQREAASDSPALNRLLVRLHELTGEDY